jgi:hypothetical protein
VEPATERVERTRPDEAGTQRRPTSRTPVDVMRCDSGALDTMFAGPSTASRISRSISPVRRSPIAARVRIDRRGIIRRNAATWDSWANTNLAGEGHTFEDSGGLIVINKAIDASEAFLTSLSSTTAGTDQLKDIIRAAKNLRDKRYDATKLDDPHKANVKRWQTSEGGRLRFRGAIGPTTDPSSSAPGVSMVEKFITEQIEPIWSPLPDFLTIGLTPQSRSRLFDLPNSGHNTPKKLPELRLAMTWAKEQGARDVSQFVNYTEYRLAYASDLETEKEKAAAEDFEKRRKANTLPKAPADDNDPTIVAEAKRLAEQAEITALKKEFGKFFGAMRKTGISAAHVVEAKAREVTVTEGGSFDDFTRAIEAAAKAKVDGSGFVLTPLHKAEARKSIEKGLADQERANLVTSHEKRLETELATKFKAERAEVSTAGYAGTGPQISGWDTAPDSSRIDLIKKKAKEAKKIPFFSDDAAVYHGLKHYDDLKLTEDKAASDDKKIEAYLASATKTVAEPDSTTVSFGQTATGPSYFFFRTVPKSSEPTGEPKEMRAIVVVSADGKVNIATYFKKP